MSETRRIDPAHRADNPPRLPDHPDPGEPLRAQQAPSAARSRAWTRVITPARAHAATLVVGYVGLLGLMHGTWFRGDDFEFLANRVGADRSLSIWYPHNEHWSTAPIAIWRVLYDTVGVSSSMPYLALSLAAHILVVHMVWRLMVRAEVAPWTAVGLAATMLVLGIGWENITWAFQLGFMGAIGLGLSAFVLSLRDERWATVGAVVVAVLALTFSGIAVPFVVAAAVCLLLRGQTRRAVVLGGVAGTVYVVWFAWWGHQAPPAPHTQTTVNRLAAAASWAWQLLSNALGGLTSLTGFGGVLVVVVTTALVVGLRRTREAQGSWRPDGGWPIPFVVVAACLFNVVLQAVNLAITRNDISDPSTSRYLYVLVGLLLPAIGVLLTRAERWVGRAVPLLVAVYLVATQGVLLLAQERPYEAAAYRDDVWGLAALVQSGEPMTNASLAIDLDVQTVRKWVAEGALDPSTATAQSILDARALSQVVVSASAESTEPGQVTMRGLPLGTESGSCSTSGAPPTGEAGSLTLLPGQSVGVVNEGAGNLTYQVVQGDQASRVVTFPAAPNSPLWLSVTVPTELRIISDNGQDITFCNP